jgi:hypothetical protein
VLGIDAVADEADEIGQDLDGVAGEGALFEVFVGFPDFGGRDVVGWLADGESEGFELFVNEVPFGLWFVVENLQGGDFVLIVFKEFLPVLDEAAGAFLVVAGVDDFVAADVVDGDFGVAALTVEEFAEVGLGGDGGDGFVGEVEGGFFVGFVCGEVGKQAGRNRLEACSTLSERGLAGCGGGKRR